MKRDLRRGVTIQIRAILNRRRSIEGRVLCWAAWTCWVSTFEGYLGIDLPHRSSRQPSQPVTFAQRDEHNLDELAQQFLRENVGVADLQSRLQQPVPAHNCLWEPVVSLHDSLILIKRRKGCLQPRVALNIPRPPASRPGWCCR